MQLPKVYEPQVYEADIYALWEKSGAFAPKDSSKGEPFSIVLPPPNANGDLHVGHSLMFAIQDAVIRYYRMTGRPTLWVPGADHAGFETQVVYEKQLAKTGKSRFDLTRDELYDQIWDFVAANRDNYQQQFRRLGASVDWTAHTYTLDKKVITRAYQTFKQLWDDGLVYRGERLVNFCTFHGTGFADIEVEYKDEASHLWHIAYPLTDGSGTITVATTRPETMLGDTAVAVHPDDARYAAFHGKTVKLPLTNREIPIITDDFVEQSFGTGAVKITPAHDPNDYEAGKRHDLPFITVISHEGTMTHDMPEAYRGLPVLEARKAVVADLKQLGVLVQEEAYNHSVGHCYKCGTVIQPLLREQWFIDMKPLAETAINALQANKITFYPESKKTQLIGYLEGLRDWNISRQIAWGIPIPAFQNTEDPEDWIYDESVDQSVITRDGKTYRRDPDVFDTWFSSSSWPYATLDYPSDLSKQFYPNSLMETGGEILYPWVSRMIMLGLYVTGDIPFKEVYIHGYVLAEDGSKMSKSVGNVINPMGVIDAYGSDALRMGLLAGRSPAVNRGYDTRRVEEARNFCNKLWNIARFIEDKVGDDYPKKAKPEAVTVVDTWMLSKLHQSIGDIGSLITAYRLSEAYELLYHLIWDDVADWYIEASKHEPNPSVLAYTLETILKLAHPFAPFVTETIWQTLKWEGDSLLATTVWPKAQKVQKQAITAFSELQAIIGETRTIMATLGIRGGVTMYHASDPLLAEHGALVARLARLDAIQAVDDGEGLHLAATGRNCWLDVDQESLHAYAKQVSTKIVATQATITQLEGRLSNASYVANAPKHLVTETRTQLAEAHELLAHLSAEQNRFVN